MSGSPSNYADFQNDRPTLPPIQELSRPSVPLEPPSSILARLSVADDDHDVRRRGSSSVHGIYSPPLQQRSLSGPKPPLRPSDAAASPTYTSSLLPPTASSSRYVPSRSMSFSAPSSSRLSDAPAGLRQNLPHRNSISTSTYAMDNRGEERTPIARYGPPSARFVVPGVREGAPWAGTITTSVDRSRHAEDDEQTPVARTLGTSSPPTAFSHVPLQAPPSVSGAKYECTYCGKGFNRPSSLKVRSPRLTSHQGSPHRRSISTATPEKNVGPDFRPATHDTDTTVAFVCPVEGCGRSFSVLSNMRRHARVHSSGDSSVKAADSSDEGGERGASPMQASSSASSRGSVDFSTWRQQRRRDSIASATSTTSSRRSRSASIASDDEEAARPGKRRK
ncbi:uncharacterized protein SCHCODRAFT_01356580 [Schizophyllum commune H4-8]|nr:uncharacterized protein SCHCODRAFT_01356580 [Schizophyllum commune H4-8]KAI5890604.1 hypothetical protein SCHCODRAFT_01356580 [Schizophyllum commune H4-8]